MSFAPENEVLAELPTNSDVLEGLRLASARQLDWLRDPAISNELLRREFIASEPQGPCYDAPARKEGSVNTGAFITTRGRAALDWLLSIERSPKWAELRRRSYGE